jgi:hypothetical protein
MFSSKFARALNSSFIAKMIEISKENDSMMASPEYREIINKQMKFQLEVGWQVLRQITLGIIFFTVPFYFFFSNFDVLETSIYARRRVFIIVVLQLLNKLNSTKYRVEFIFNNFLLFFWFIFGIMLTFESIVPETPEQFDFWLLYLLILFLLTFIYCFTWRKLIVAYWAQRIFYLIMAYQKYGNQLKFINFMYQAVVLMLYPILCILILKMILIFLVSVHHNKKLASSIKNILQVFPECVIIRGKDHNSGASYEPVFINNQAVKELWDEEDVEVNILKDNDENVEKIDLERLLTSQENKIRESVHIIEAADIGKIMVTRYSEDNKGSDEPKFYTLKTLKVTWSSSSHAFMHVFISTASIHKLESAKATNKCMHIMYSSISHELRTPINAFVNAIEMIKFSSDAIKAKIRDDKKNNFAQIVKMMELIDKNVKISIISSNLLLSLTEDILDFAKIEAGTFALNPQKFSVGGLIKEITFIFSNQ